jgi:Ca2+-transporting ATPase
MERIFGFYLYRGKPKRGKAVPDIERDGLTSAEAQKRLAEFGPNRMYAPNKVSFFGIAKHEITEPMILLLFVVGIVYSVWGKLDDAITIFAVIVVLVLAEVNNEFRAVKAIVALEEISAPKAKVLRDGTIKEVDSLDVVPGDVLILTQGTKISADARIVRSIGLQLNESALTGESAPNDKGVDDKVYAGTVVSSGEGSALVIKTGSGTEFGKIASTSKEVRPPRTKLQLEMKALAGKLVYVALFFSIIIPLIGVLQGRDLKTMVLIGLSLSFATIPEELPIIITMVLGLGAYTLSRNKLLIKRLTSAEALGTATVIVTDKTGTITEGRMRVVSLYPKGRNREIVQDALCAVTDYSATYIDNEIRSYAKQLKIKSAKSDVFRQRNFGDGKKTRTVIRSGNGYTMFMSGAPEEVLACCGRIGADIRTEMSSETAKGRRVIAVAFKRLTQAMANAEFQKLEKNLEFVGLISFEDSVRKGVKETIADVARAGIRTIMVTGDHPATAGFIAGTVGIRSDTVITGEELDMMSDSRLQKAVREVSVFARATPMHKYRIMRALQKNGEVVAVTGDGINDVLALQGADIGVAMGIRGTDVAKDAASIVLADDNYVTIAQGIFEGRKFFDNLQKGIEYYLSVKVALVAIFLLPILLVASLPFAPIQIIVLELFMDLAASAGFVAEPKEKDINSRPPRDPKERIFNSSLIRNVMLKGLALFVAVMVAYFYAKSIGLGTAEVQTFAFSAWMFGYIALAFVSRSDREPLQKIGVFSNKVINLWALASIGFLLVAVYVPAVSTGFNLTPISVGRLALVALVSVLIVGMLEVKKYLHR